MIIKQKFYETPDKSSSGVVEELKPRFIADNDLLTLGKEQLSKVEFDDKGKAFIMEKTEKKVDTAAQDQPPKDDKAAAPADKDKPTNGEKPPDAPTLDAEIKVIEDIPKSDRTKEQVLELRRLHAEKKMHEATQTAADLKRQLDERDKRLFELEAKEIPEFEYLEDKDYAELPKDEQKIYDQEKSQYETAVANRAQISNQKTIGNIAAFYTQVLGTKQTVEEVLKDPKFGEFLKSDDFHKLDQFVTKKMQKEYDGTYSLDTLLTAHLALNRDRIVTDAETRGRTQAAEDIIKANNSDASTFDRVPKETGTRGVKKLSDYTADEIAGMPHSMLEQLRQQMQTKIS